MIDYEADWNGRLLRGLYWQFKKKTRVRAWVTMVARQFQDLENAIQAFLTLLSIDDSVGPQLDNLGRIVGQPRAGVDDATYRLYLKARIVANRSGGTPEDVYSVFRALFGTGTVMVVTESQVKSFALRLSTVITAVQAAVAIGFLRDSKEAGARGILQWQETADSGMFAFDNGGLGFDVGDFAGAGQA